jgi:nitroreductase
VTTAPSTPAAKPNEAWFEDTWWWKIKLRLQWSGWLQYIPNLVVAVVMLLLAVLGTLVGVFHWLFVGLPLVLAALLFINLLFDLATVRFGFHLVETEPKPRHNLGSFDLLRSRKSCRSFQKRNLSDAHRVALLEYARVQAENSIGPHPIRFEYLAAPLTVWPVVNATEFLVAIAERDYHELAVVDIGRSLQNVVLDATRLGLATCWIGPGADPSSIAKHLGARFNPARDHVICVCAVGYASRYKPLMLRLMQRSQKQRHALKELFFRGIDCTDSLNPSTKPFSEFGRCFEGCQWSPSSYNAQPTRAAAVVEDGRIVRMDFCAATKSRYYAMVALGIWLANWEHGCRALGIDGHFERVTKDDTRRPDLPRYVISWLRET